MYVRRKDKCEEEILFHYSNATFKQLYIFWKEWGYAAPGPGLPVCIIVSEILACTNLQNILNF